jgi:hypothetical protein
VSALPVKRGTILIPVGAQIMPTLGLANLKYQGVAQELSEFKQQRARTTTRTDLMQILSTS